MKKKFILSILSLCFTYNMVLNSTERTNIIIDFDGVLSRANTFKYIWQTGPFKFLGLYNPLRLYNAIFTFLDTVMPYNLNNPNVPPLFHNGTRLPALLVASQLGEIKSEQALALIESKYPELLRCCDSKRKAQLIKEAASLLFIPDKFARTISPVKQGIKLVKKCYQAKHSDGSRKNRIFILTNWDSESFKFLAAQEQFSSLFDMCDGIIVSGDVGLVKPQPEMFHYAFKQFDINPDTELTIYIDDEPDNIAAAQNLGFRKLRPMLCEKFNFDPIKKKLTILEVF